MGGLHLLREDQFDSTVRPDVVLKSWEYGDINTNTDMSIVLQKMRDIAVAGPLAAGYRTKILLPEGQNFRTLTADPLAGSPAAVAVPSNLQRMLTVGGPAPRATVIKQTDAAPALFGFYSADFGSGKNLDASKFMQWFTMENLLIDHQFVGGTSTSHGVVVAWNALNFQARQIRRRNVDTQNVGAGNKGSSGANQYARCFDLHSNQNILFGSQQYYIGEIYVDECYDGVTGGGGNTGILIAGSLPSGDIPDWRVANGELPANVVGGFIHIRDYHHDAQLTDFSGIKSGVGNAIGVQINLPGAAIDGEWWWSKSNMDGNFEIDSCQSAHVRHLRAQDGWNAMLYVRPANHGVLRPHEQWICFEDVEMSYPVTTALGSGRASQPLGIRIMADDFGVGTGSVIVRDYRQTLDGPNGIVASGPLNDAWGEIDNLTIERHTIALRNFDYDGGVRLANGYTSFGAQLEPWRVELASGRGVYRREDVKMVVQGKFRPSYPASPGTKYVLTLDGCHELSFGDHVVIGDGHYVEYSVDFSGTQVATPQWSSRVMLDPSRKGFTDAFTDLYTTTGGVRSISVSGQSFFVRGWRPDLGDIADWLVQPISPVTDPSNPPPNGLFLAANYGAEHRATQFKNENANNTGLGNVGRHTDWSAAVAVFTLGAFQPGLRAGVRLKARATLGQELQSVVFYDPADGNTKLQITYADATILAAVPLQTVTLFAGPPPNGHQVRGTIRDGRVTASYFAPGNVPAGPDGVGVPDSTIAATLTGAVLAMFGSGSPQGRPGVTFTPVDANAYLANWQVFPMSVVSADFRNDRIQEFSPRGAAAVTALGVRVGVAANPSAWVRFSKTAEFRFDHVKAAGLAGVDFSGFDATLLDKMLLRGDGYMTPPATAAVTLAGSSPWTVPNDDGHPNVYVVDHPNVTLVEISTDRSTWTPLGIAPGTTPPIPSGGGVRVTTTSGTPTVTKVPVLA